jgi:hypothetical protein
MIKASDQSSEISVFPLTWNLSRRSHGTRVETGVDSGNPFWRQREG